MAKDTKKPTKPIARNNAARKSMQTYFKRVADSLHDKMVEYQQMKKCARVYSEAQELLRIQTTIDLAAATIFEINMSKKLDCSTVEQFAQLLNTKNLSIKEFIRGKPVTLQIKLLHELAKNIHKIATSIQQITKNINRINEIIPVIKVLLQKKEVEEDEREHDPLLNEINNALKMSLDEPNLIEIKALLQQEKIDLNRYDSKFSFEHFNDVSDKIIGVLNDKLLVAVEVSETLIAGMENEGTHDISTEQRLPDELTVLFLVENALNILYKIKEIRENIKVLFSSVRLYSQLIENDKLETKFKATFKNGDNNIHSLISLSLKHIQKLEPVISELADKIEPLKLDESIRLTHALIYEKVNRIWENPYRS